ncbi:MAG: DUF5011 domain-containing protein [Nanoarchaeota archaeon]|nr:DUF5011 domain-containing protein [Nanoarchaeota archaeon]
MLFAGFSDTTRRIAIATLIVATLFTGTSQAGEFSFISDTSARFQEGQFLPAIFGDPYRTMNEAGIRPFSVRAELETSGRYAVTFVNTSVAWQVVTLGNFTAMSIGNIPSSFLIGPKEIRTFLGIEFYSDGREQYIEFRTNKNAIRALGARAADTLARGLFAKALSSDNFRGSDLPELVGAVAPDIVLDVLTNLLSSNGTGVNNILAENFNLAVQSSNPHTESIASLMQQATNNPEAARKYKELAALRALDAILTIKDALEVPERTNLILELIGGTIASPNEATIFLRAIPQGKPKITHIDHVRGLNTQQPIQIHGLGFQNGAGVTLTASDGTYPIPASRTTFVSENLIEISANVTDMTDLWFAQVENPGGLTSVRYFFLVIASNQWVRFGELTNPQPAERQQINVLPVMEALGVLRDKLIEFLNQINVGDGLNRFRPDNLPNFVLTSQGEIVIPTAEGTLTPGGGPGIPPDHVWWAIIYIIRGGDPDEYYAMGPFYTMEEAEAKTREPQTLWQENRFSKGDRKADRIDGHPHHQALGAPPPREQITLEELARRYPPPWNQGPLYATVESGGMTPVKLHRPWYMGTPVFVWSLDPGTGSLKIQDGGWYLEWTLPRNTTGKPITYTLYLVVNPNPNTSSPPNTFSVTVLPEDTEAPIITMRGDAVVLLTKGNAWSDPGATAEDNGKPISVETRGEVTTGVVGTYTLTYVARDAAGNESSVTRVVNVAEEIYEFTVVLPEGASILHVPLKVEGLERVSDLISLLGEKNVQVAIVAIEGKGVPFHPDVTARGSDTDIKLESYTAVLLWMRQEVKTTFRGRKPEGRVELRKGWNFVGIPLKGAVKKVSDFAALSRDISHIYWDDREGAHNRWLIRQVNGRYIGTDEEIRGGVGLDVFTNADATLTIEGEAWQNPAPAASPRLSLWEEALLGDTRLFPNYPNPFNPETWIPFQLSEDADVSLTVYDLTGNVVRVLDMGRLPAGSYTSRAKAARWDGTNTLGERVASGPYLYRIEAGSYSATRRMVILK